jgi:hypothetical protein
MGTGQIVNVAVSFQCLPVLGYRKGPPVGKERVHRGGCYLVERIKCRSAARNWDPPGDTYYYLGFRVHVGHYNGDLARDGRERREYALVSLERQGSLHFR